MKFERPLQEKELNKLNRRLDQLNIKRRNKVRFLVIWTLLALIVGTIAYFNIDPQVVIVLYLTVAAYIGVGVWVVIEQQVDGNREKKSIAFLKSKNLVTVVQVRSDTFYVLDEEDDEGIYYLFQLENDKVFSFGGQDFCEDDNFPSDKFEIVEGRGIKNEILILETFVQGKKIQPKQIIRGKEKWDILGSSHYPDPDKLTIADGRIEDYVK
jgi:hypothetical protein